MPRIAIDYSTRPVVFYRFVCENPEITCSYVGSTVDFYNRKSSHKSTLSNTNRKEYNFKLYKTIRENGGWDNWRMVQIESRLVSSKREAEKIEQEWIEKFNSDLNSHKAYLGETPKDAWHKYYIQNKEEMNMKHKIYREEHKEELKVKQKEYYEENKEKINANKKTYREQNIDKIHHQQKIYFETNRDEINKRRLANNLKYRTKNKDIINQKAREKRAEKKLEKLKSTEDI